MIRIQRHLLPHLLAMAAMSPAAFACQYNVRDVGFVDLGTDLSQLVFVSDGSEPGLIQAAEAVLIESNVPFTALTPGDLAGKPWAAHLDGDPLFLLAPDGRVLTMGFEESTAAGMKAAAEAAVSSPLRTKLQEAVAHQYAVVLIVESSDSAANESAHKAAESAVIRATATMAMLPKEIAEPPVVMTVSPDAFEEERVLLWSLGIDEPVDEPRAVVLYGRARIIGEVLAGEAIDADMVANFLAVVGADCECGLDRSWMQGHMIPMRWNRAWQEQLAEKLGFDTENPMVKLEMSTSIAKNAHKQPVESAVGVPDAVPFNLAYSETSVSFDDEDDTSSDMDPEEADIEEPEVATATTPAVPEAAEALAVDNSATKRNLALAAAAVVLGAAIAGTVIIVRARARTI